MGIDHLLIPQGLTSNSRPFSFQCNPGKKYVVKSWRKRVLLFLVLPCICYFLGKKASRAGSGDLTFLACEGITPQSGGVAGGRGGWGSPHRSVWGEGRRNTEYKIKFMWYAPCHYSAVIQALAVFPLKTRTP